jgi:hypothetical protein
MWPGASEINDDDEQDTAREIDKDKEIRNQTSPARIIISPTTINHEHHQHKK